MAIEVRPCLSTSIREPRTAPAQKISLGHHGWVGGSATCEGTAFVRGTVGLATEVESVIDGAPVLAAPEGEVAEACGSANAYGDRASATAIVARIEIGDMVGAGNVLPMSLWSTTETTTSERSPRL